MIGIFPYGMGLIFAFFPCLRQSHSMSTIGAKRTFPPAKSPGAESRRRPARQLRRSGARDGADGERSACRRPRRPVLAQCGALLPDCHRGMIRRHLTPERISEASCRCPARMRRAAGSRHRRYSNFHANPGPPGARCADNPRQIGISHGRSGGRSPRCAG